MPYRPSPNHVARVRQAESWTGLPDSVFENLGMDRETVADFSRSLLGNVVLPGEGAYPSSARTSFQTTARQPKIIAYCNVEADIRACLLWARRHALWVVPRSGGHSTAGYSVNDGMVIDVSRMNSVYVDPAAMTATVGSGTNFGTLNAVLNSYRLHVPGGVCPDVGIAGYMQGGGYCYTSRQFGMNCDNVLGFRMMLYDGRTVKASDDQNADLYWAVRGGTGNNFGVLIDVTYRLQPMWEVWAFGLAWTLDVAPRVLAKIQSDYIHTAGPSKLGFMGFVSNRVDFGNQAMLTIRGIYNGHADDGRAELASLSEIGNAVFDVDTVQPYLSALNAIDETALIDMPWDKVKEDKQACYIDKPLGETGWRKVLDYFADAPDGTFNLACFEPYGGAIAYIPPDACAFVHRDADLDFFVDTFWSDEVDAAAASAWLDGYMAVMEPYSNGQVYQNYPRRSLTDTNRRYFGGNYDRLLAVKNKYDPVPHMFHFEQGICTSEEDPGAFLEGPPPPAFSAEPILYEPHIKSP